MPVLAEHPFLRELARVGEVGVWGADLTQPPPVVEAMAGVLSAAERLRAARLATGVARRRFLVARASLRMLLAEATGIRADRLDLRAGPAGKPFLVPDGAAPAPEFNLSHARDLALIGVGGLRPIGIDVAWTGESLPLDTIARRFFSTAEQEWVAAASMPDRRERWFRLWVRKESYLKGLGEGISPEIHRTELASLGPKPGSMAPRSPQGRHRWLVEDLDGLPQGYVASLAVACTDPSGDPRKVGHDSPVAQGEFT